MNKRLLEVMLDANTPMTRKVRAAALKKKSAATMDKEVWHNKTKKWLSHDDPTLNEAAAAVNGMLREAILLKPVRRDMSKVPKIKPSKGVMSDESRIAFENEREVANDMGGNWRRRLGSYRYKGIKYPAVHMVSESFMEAIKLAPMKTIKLRHPSAEGMSEYHPTTMEAGKARMGHYELVYANEKALDKARDTRDRATVYAMDRRFYNKRMGPELEAVSLSDEVDQRRLRRRFKRAQHLHRVRAGKPAMESAMVESNVFEFLGPAMRRAVLKEAAGLQAPSLKFAQKLISTSGRFKDSPGGRKKGMRMLAIADRISGRKRRVNVTRKIDELSRMTAGE